MLKLFCSAGTTATESTDCPAASMDEQFPNEAWKDQISTLTCSRPIGSHNWHQRIDLQQAWLLDHITGISHADTLSEDAQGTSPNHKGLSKHYYYTVPLLYYVCQLP